MLEFDYLAKDDHDRIVRIGGVDVSCYSKKKLKELSLSTAAAREARSYSEKELAPREDGTETKAASKRVGTLNVRSLSLGVSNSGANNPILYKKVGYLTLADGTLVALCVSRAPFLAVLGALLGVFAITGAIIGFSLLGGDSPIILPPDNPLPDIDDNLVPDDTYTGEAGEVPEGGGLVSMVYMLEASYYLSSEEIVMYFKNPAYSSHDVVMEFYVVSGGSEYLLAKTGRVPAGYRVQEMTPIKDAPVLSQGKYTGLYRVSYYDPYTGVRAHVQADITDIEITVKP